MDKLLRVAHPLLLALLSLMPLRLMADTSICQLFKQHPEWQEASHRAAKRWHVSTASLMAITHQESHFQADASPQKSGLLQWIPWVSTKNAFGYAQATNTSWRWYCQSRHRLHADRSRFEDAIDFVGWYIDKAHHTLQISKTDTYHLYLAYHEGLSGYQRQDYKHKAWLKRVASKVAQLAKRYQQQLGTCAK